MIEQFDLEEVLAPNRALDRRAAVAAKHIIRPSTILQLPQTTLVTSVAGAASSHQHRCWSICGTCCTHCVLSAAPSVVDWQYYSVQSSQQNQVSAVDAGCDQSGSQAGHMTCSASFQEQKSGCKTWNPWFSVRLL